MTPKNLNLSPEQLALSEQRKQKKLLAQTRAPKLIDLEKGQILPRKWITLPDVVVPNQRVKVMTWNVCYSC
jgi:hypothetical protein